MFGASKSSKIVALCSLANFINAADRTIMPIAVVPMADQYHWNLGQQGWILSAFAYGYISSQVLGGKAAQRFGGRHVLSIAVSIWSAATFLTPMIASNLHALTFARIILGFAEGFCLPTIFQIFANAVPVEERSRAFGYLVALGSIGQTLSSIICPHLPWPMMFHSFGMLGFVWVVIWLMCYSNDDITVDDTEKLLRPTVDTTNTVTWTSYLSHRSLWAMYIAHFAMNFSNYIVLSWLPTYLQRHLGANALDVSYTALPYIMNSLVGVAAGHYADSLIAKKWTVLSVRRLMTSIGLLGPAVFLMLFGSVDSLALALSFVSISLGLCGCNSSGHMSNHPDVAPNHAGITFAVSNTFATIPGLVCGPVTAAIVEYTGYWYPVFVIASGVNIFGSIVYMSQSSASQVL